MCCSVLQCVAVCGSVLQCVAVCRFWWRHIGICNIFVLKRIYMVHTYFSFTVLYCRCWRVSVCVCVILFACTKKNVPKICSKNLHITISQSKTRHTPCGSISSNTSSNYSNALQRTGTHWNTLQRTATHCNTPRADHSQEPCACPCHGAPVIQNITHFNITNCEFPNFTKSEPFKYHERWGVWTS